MTSLWRYNKTTGYWVFCRECCESVAQDWLKVWQNDEPTVSFVLSPNRPKVPPI